MRALLPVVLGVSLLLGCVSSGEYEKKVSELQKQSATLAETEKALGEATAERDALRKQLDDSTALVGQLKQKLEKLGQNVDRLAGEKGQLSTTLADAKLRLDELRKQEAAAEARATTFRALVQRLHAMIDSGQLKVVIRNGQMLIDLPNDVLFDSGRVDIKPAGKAALAQVAQALSAIPDREFVVAGHTDNVPIHSARFPSNWELSTARAVEVVNFLVANGMKPEVLAASGYGEFSPVAANDSTENRALNRRIEIVLQPNLSELPALNVAQTGS